MDFSCHVSLNVYETRLLGRPQPQMYPPVALNAGTRDNLRLVNCRSLFGCRSPEQYFWNLSLCHYFVLSDGFDGSPPPPQIARRRRSASGYKRQIATSGPPPVSRWLASGTFPLLADVGPPSDGHRRPTIGWPPAGHRWLATVVPTMSAILKNIRSENTCSSTFRRGIYFLVIA